MKIHNEIQEKLKLSSDKAFYAFLASSLLLSLIVSILLVGSRADDTVRALQQQSSKVEAELAASYLRQFLETRQQILQDLARHPILTNGVMGTDLSKASLSDFLDGYKILGEQESIRLINILGDVVYSNRPKQMEPFTHEVQWLAQVLDERIGHAIVLDKTQQSYFFKVLVPVQYNGFTEGALLVEFQTSLHEMLSIALGNKTHAISIEGPWVSFSNMESGQEYISTGLQAIGETGIEFEYFSRVSTIDKKVWAFMFDIGWAIVISLLLSSGLLLIFGRQLLLNPFKQLEKAQQETAENEARYKLAVQGSHDGLWDWNVITGEVYYAPRYRQLLGYDDDDFESFPNDFSSLEAHLHPSDKDRVLEQLNRHIEHGDPYDVGYKLRHATGEYRHYRAKGIALRDDIGRAIRMAGSLTDITEQKLFQEALKKAKEHNDLLAQAIESCNVGICISDATTDEQPLVFINSAFTRITGYDKRVLGKNCRFLQGKETSKDAVAEIRNALTQRKKHRVEILNYKADGTAFWNSLQISPVFDEEGALTAFVGIQQDISDRIESQQALIEAKAMAENASIAKSEFLASMSHEIRTPMNGVLGMLNLLLNSNLTEEQHHRARVAMSSANSLLTLINDILDFSKVDAGKLELEYLDFDLRGMLGEFAESAAIQAHDKQLELVLNMTNINESVVKGDPGRLRQILTNLVSNAIKFTSEGEVVIETSLSDSDDEYWLFECNIRDTGIGISHVQQRKLFKSFSQVDASTTRKYGGTGLGLAIVKKLCELMHGDVSVSSDVGRGSQFTFAVKLQKSAGSLQVIPTVDVSKLHLLIVDDNDTNREVLRGQLEHWGARVSEAGSGVQALAICELYYEAHNTCFDIAFLDMQMPSMDGAQLGKALVANPRFKNMKLVMMTSMGHQGDARFFADLGFAGYFPKPATTSDLFDALAIVAENGEALAKADPLVTTHYIKTLKNKVGAEIEDVEWCQSVRILLAEDNQVNQIVATSMFKKMGVSFIDVAANGKEVISYLKQAQHSEPYKVIFMDCQMPEMDGYEATHAIRQGKGGALYKKIPIIAMTANAMVGDKNKCLEAGMDDYVAKPIVPEVLFEKMLTWLPHNKKE
ncbi:PAS domain-containing hybrid sensor histidine kinase/response regulator [Pseudoalteromonas sp. MSK9-3]|uniref:PAS domain-containing hybrid sensor histidine kinase/response regulator n=1 Tax=Pseudoalteromonas sp. MSK9-3 TaxID=1897633 RepID=UPI000E6CC137|nr:PAS domain-containing hybrid sensor histidine kinase/response regulator [Pseudoalteromonas sp. MSK9-3]